MGKLKGKALQTIKDNVATVRKSSSKNVYFHCRSNAGGVEVRDVIRTVYKPEDVTRYNYDIEWMFTLGMSEWIDFRAKFKTESDANECYNEVYAAINSAYAEEPNTYVLEDTEYLGNEVTGNSGTVTTKAKDWTTYIVIGAAAAIILLLLWNRKKK